MRSVTNRISNSNHIMSWYMSPISCILQYSAIYFFLVQKRFCHFIYVSNTSTSYVKKIHEYFCMYIFCVFVLIYILYAYAHTQYIFIYDLKRSIIGVSFGMGFCQNIFIINSSIFFFLPCATRYGIPYYYKKSRTKNTFMSS